MLSSNRHGIAFVVVTFVFLVSTFVVIHANKAELLPQLWVSLLAATLSYWACVFSAEKFRLDLFERRFEVYSRTLTYCSVVAAYGGLNETKENQEKIQEAIVAAHDSFRGIGHHKARALFGADIDKLFEELNKGYAFIIAYGDQDARQIENSTEEYWKHVRRTVDIASELPKLFRPYMYFGDYKRSFAE